MTQYLENNGDEKVVFPLIYEFSAGYNYQFPNSSAILTPGIGYSFSLRNRCRTNYNMTRYLKYHSRYILLIWRVNDVPRFQYKK
ncbi:MAG: hypothetical protein R2771_07870 [Saprospiraceae bacterium]